MNQAAARRPVLPDSEFERLVALTKQADSVELKLTVAEHEQRSALAALGLDPLDAQIRQVFFFDTPDLALDSAGVVVRARRVQRKGDDSVVKLRPVVPSELPKRLRRSPSFGVEVDAMPEGFVCSGSMRRSLPVASVRDVVTGTVPVRELFSKQQRALFEAHTPGVELDALSVLGPIFVLKLKSAPAGYARSLVAEAWLYPDNTWIVELSTKCAPPEAFQVAAEVRAYLTERGISIAGKQQTKTRTALQFFSRRLKES